MLWRYRAESEHQEEVGNHVKQGAGSELGKAGSSTGQRTSQEMGEEMGEEMR